MSRNLFLAILASAVVITVGIQWAPKTLIFREDALGQILAWLGSLAGIALCMERGIEVFLSAWRGGKADLQDMAISRANDELEKALEAVKRSSDTSAAEALKRKAEEVRIQLEELLTTRTKYRIYSRNIALLTSLVFGIILSALGLRALHYFFEPASIAALAGTPQETLLRITDMLLTGSLLAGGSDAINKLTKVYSSAMQSAAQKARA